MDKNIKSSDASATFSAQALGLAKTSAKPESLAPAFALHERAEPKPPPTGAKSLARPSRLVTPTPSPHAAVSGPSALPRTAQAGLSLSDEGKSRGVGKVATTIDAGAPTGSGHRLRAYGEAQKALAPKGAGFDKTA